MRSIYARNARTTASVLLGFGAMALALLAGCSGNGPTAPARTWEEVRYHWSVGQDGSDYGDVVIRPTGEMVWNLQGARAANRGLLAGENLETLTRLIDALPPAGFDGSTADCDRAYFLTVTTGSGERSYRAGACDSSTPAALRSVTGTLDAWVTDAASPRPEVVAFRLLARGSQSRVATETRRVAANRDQLVALLDMIGDSRASAIGGVDFSRQIVIGIFIGEHPSEAWGVDVTGVSRTEGGKLVIKERWFEPEADCDAPSVRTAPYALIAVDVRAGEDFVSEVERQTLPCGTGAP